MGTLGPQRATLRKIEEANVREQLEAAELAERKMQNASKKLGKDVLEEFMNLFAGMAATYQPLPPGMLVPPGRQPDEAKFERWARLAVETAGKLAPFQSPTFKAIAVMAPAPVVPGDRAKAANVIDINDPVAVARVYQQRIKGAA